MRRFVHLRFTITVAAIIVAMIWPNFLCAQNDAGDASLGDVARSFRKKVPSQGVIDNDNFTKVMDDADHRRPAVSSLKYSIDGAGKSFQISSPDVTCSLAFSANTKALLSSQYAQLDLPPNELLKLEGPAALDGDSLKVSVFNGTDWHVSEVAVALTLLKRTDVQQPTSYFGTARLLPPAVPNPQDVPDSPAQKRPDVTMLYRIRAAAPPSSTTVFSAPLNVDIAPDQEWHWAIVQARGYPPETSAPSDSPTAKPTSSPSQLPSAQQIPQSLSADPSMQAAQ